MRFLTAISNNVITLFFEILDLAGSSRGIGDLSTFSGGVALSFPAISFLLLDLTLLSYFFLYLVLHFKVNYLKFYGRPAPESTHEQPH